MHTISEDLTIRDCNAADTVARDALITRAFLDAPHSNGTEAAIAAALDSRGMASVSLLALRAGVVVGCVLTSPVTLSDGTTGWHGLGPIAVEPTLQGQGIGVALMDAALARLRAEDAAGCVVLGDPAYYGHFGFIADARLAFPGVPPEYFQSLSFSDAMPEAIVRYDVAFDAS
ncbi:N-acetyltransferase [Luteimonas fraxinea]|uniref:N-acetyltransferase n=1 Tax=Luteimonas fraxinea TaxID=2901869 RepID=A0ABS8UJ95_9GAMM|nr:N-acetyltransferase [Luteimonas fraxinea]MCD9098791.1 N-acetyltransferase [Luteimonas fraxinea]MCD9127462.1 N-acetyltransferase [Luteimonas fraxinea]UHH10444.1 N-acetyltransferase [Luteimonas fraxinea]